MYIDILHHLRDAFRRKCPEKWRTNIRFLLHENAPVHQSVLVENLLAKSIPCNLLPSLQLIFTCSLN
jgi:hypothetical protein